MYDMCNDYLPIVKMIELKKPLFAINDDWTLNTGNTEEATFLVAKYICLEQQTFAWKKK